MLNDIVAKVFAFLGNLPLQTIVMVILSAFVAFTLLAVVLTLSTSRFKRASKRPYLALVNAFTALLFAGLLLEFEMEIAVLFSVGLWFVGFMFYGLLSALTPQGNVKTFTPAPVSINKLVSSGEDLSAPAPNVRLEHALAVSEKLRLKNLTKGDRMEVERILSSLKLLENKASLSLEDGRILNDNFNAIIKYMAKYNL